MNISPTGSNNTSQSVWETLLSTWYSLLGSADYLASLDVGRVKNLHPRYIQKIGQNINSLDKRGIREWRPEQFLALGNEQLLALEPALVTLLAEKAPLELLERWLVEGPVWSLLPQLAILWEVNLAHPERRRALIEGLEQRKDLYGAGHLLCSLVEKASDEVFYELWFFLKEGWVFKVVSAQVQEDLSNDPLFRERFQADINAFIQAKSDYHNKEEAHKNFLEELDHYGKRAVRATSSSARMQLYKELQEWLHELPFEGFEHPIPGSGPLAHLSHGDQVRAIQGVLRQLQQAMKEYWDAFQLSQKHLWISIEDLAIQLEEKSERLNELERAVALSKKQLNQHEEELRKIAKTWETLAGNKKSYEKVDHLFTQMGLQVEALKQHQTQLKKLKEQLLFLNRGIENAIEEVRVGRGGEGMYIGPLPFILFIRLSKQMRFGEQPYFSFLMEHRDFVPFSTYLYAHRRLMFILGRMEQLEWELSALSQARYIPKQHPLKEDL